MTPDELDVLLEELETRLERLRALYEQYFLGIEKIEPNIARKDVDRRIWTLRREQIRNTARRFRLQTVVMRYNTFQQYWARICRDIENGTYVRHLLRSNLAESQALTIVTKRRLGLFRKGADKRAARDQARKGDAERDENELLAQAAPANAAQRALDDVLARSAQPDNDASPAVPQNRVILRQAAPKAARPQTPLEQLDLDIDFLDGGSAPAPEARPALRREDPKPALRGEEPKAAPPPVPAPPPPRVSGPGLLGRLPPPASKKVDPNPPPSTAAGLNRPAADRAARAGAARAARVDAASPSVAKAPAPQPDAAAAKPVPAAARSAGVTDDRIRELHARLIDAKRKVNDGGAVSVAGLTKSLRAAEDKLRAQHGNRRIDFDVVIKDGKAVVKPILR